MLPPVPIPVPVPLCPVPVECPYPYHTTSNPSPTPKPNQARSDVAIGSYLAERGLVQLGSYRARHDNPIPSLPSPGPSPSPSEVVARTKPSEAQNQARHLGPGLRQRQPPQPQPNRMARERAAPCAIRLLYGKVQPYCTLLLRTYLQKKYALFATTYTERQCMGRES